MTEPQSQIRRLSTGIVDVDFYRRQAAVERTACRSLFLRRLFTADTFAAIVLKGRDLRVFVSEECRRFRRQVSMLVPWRRAT